MSNTTTLTPKLKFFQYHRPQMEAGEYTVTIDGSVAHSGISGSNAATPVVQQYAVFGERFQIPDQGVSAVFPKPGSTGNYAEILPHVVLHRNTLPWERHAHPADLDTPWMALLLFDEDETPQKKVVTAGTISSGGGHFPALSVELGQHPDEKLTVIDVPKNVLQKILPADPGALKMMAHTRIGEDNAGNVVGDENSVVYCNRLPEQGKRSTVHLVSLEERYDGSGFVYPSGETNFRLVSLKSWSFYTTEHFKVTSATLDHLGSGASAADKEKLSTLLNREFAGTEASFLEQVGTESGIGTIPGSYSANLVSHSRFSKTFDGLLQHLSKAEPSMTLRMPYVDNLEAETFLSNGLVPLEHHFRNGDRSVSWYRGPFMPFRTVTEFGPIGYDSNAVLNLNPQTSDELLKWRDEVGMFDVTYAAAWEMGRMLALANKDFSTHLYHWKRSLAQESHQARQTVGNEHLPVFSHSDAGAHTTQFWDQHIAPFLNDLIHLRNVPAHYLLPTEDLLPTESIRFFEVDSNWRTATVMGAFSVGGPWTGSQQSGPNAFSTFLQEVKDRYDTGFLLRSDVVDGWPGIIVEGNALFFSDMKLEKRLLSRDIMLAVFEGPLADVVFRQKAEVLHFGLENDNGTFKKRKRDTAGNEVGAALNVPFQGAVSERVLDIPQLAGVLDKAGNPAEFAMNMVEGVPQVRFEFNRNPDIATE